MMRALSSTARDGVERAIEEARERAANMLSRPPPPRATTTTAEAREGEARESESEEEAWTMRERKPVSMKVDVGARAVVGSGMAKRAEENAAAENAAAAGGEPTKRATYTVDFYDMDVKYEGLVIGPGGMTIRKLQQDIGTSIEVVRGEGKLQIKGSEEKIAYAKKMLDEFFELKGSKTVKVGCKARSGLIIGNAGQTIKALKEQTGCRIEVMRDVEECVITGPGDRVKVAQAIIEKMIADSWEEGADGNVTIVEEVIPCAYKAGAIIGPGGNTIRNIRETTGVAVDIERGANGCRASDLCRVVGTPAQVKRAIEIIHQLLKEMGQAELNAAPTVPPMYAAAAAAYGYRAQPTVGDPNAADAYYYQQYYQQYYANAGVAPPAPPPNPPPPPP